jgi:hypothetical protein
MGVVNLSAAIPYSDGTTYPAGSIGKRIQDLLADIIAASVPDGSITAIKLATDSVTTIKIVDLNVTTGKLAANAVTLAKLVQATAQGKYLVRTTAGAGNFEEATSTTIGRQVMAAADAAAILTILGAVIGTNVQAFDTDLTAIAALTSAVDKVLISTGAGTWALAAFPAAGRALAASGASKDLVLSTRTTAATTDTVLQLDHGKVVSTTSATAVTVTLPNNLTVDTVLSYSQDGAGQITFTPASGAFLRNRQSHTKTAGQWAAVTLRVRANAGGVAAEYVMTGDTAA